MAKATTIKDALKKFEETKGVNSAEAEKVQLGAASAAKQHTAACQPLSGMLWVAD
jgi:hypothetical protein